MNAQNEQSVSLFPESLLNVVSSKATIQPMVFDDCKPEIQPMATDYSRWPYNLLDAISEDGIWEGILTESQEKGLNEALNRLPDKVSKYAMLCIFKDNHTYEELAEAWNITPARAKDIAWQPIRYICKTPLRDLIKYGMEIYEQEVFCWRKEQELLEKEDKLSQKEQKLFEKAQELSKKEKSVSDLETTLEKQQVKLYALQDQVEAKNRDVQAQLRRLRHLYRKVRKMETKVIDPQIVSSNNKIAMPVSWLRLSDTILTALKDAGFGTAQELCHHYKLRHTFTDVERIGFSKQDAIVKALAEAGFNLTDSIS